MANQYGLRMTHPPNVCPVSNKASREIAKKGWEQLPALSQKHKAKVLSWYHFDPEHLSIAIIEAENIESVRNMIMEAGMMHWNDLTINPVTPVQDLMKDIDRVPTIF